MSASHPGFRFQHQSNVNNASKGSTVGDTNPVGTVNQSVRYHTGRKDHSDTRLTDVCNKPYIFKSTKLAAARALAGKLYGPEGSVQIKLIF